MIFRSIREFLRVEAASGILLMAALLIALLIANSPLFPLYQKFIHMPVQLRIGWLDIDKSLEHWVNEGLMALFFMLLALEIKREVVAGELSSFSRIIFPFFAAIGGIVAPILIYFAFIGGNASHKPGWAIPTTTDIALVLGLLALLGKRIPINLKLFLVALSIVDDIAAITLIAFFYSNDISIISLVIAASGVLALVMLNINGVKKISPYMIIGIIIWVAVLKSGIHATLAGIAVGFCIPLTGNDKIKSPLRKLEHTLHPWVAYLIMPFFVLINAGIPFTDEDSLSLLHPVPMGIIFGLFVGKQVGIFSFAFIAVKCRLTKLPRGVNWWQIYGIAVLSGIGFTMSLFIATLAFGQGAIEVASRQAIVLGSLLSGI